MRRVKIIERPRETYSYAAVDQQTGEIPLRLSERADLVALVVGWGGWSTGLARKQTPLGRFAAAPR